jgi:tetratricopeptide (TPR) repeat protein
MVYYFASRYHEAIAQLEATLELDSEYSHARSFLGRAYLRLGEFDKALKEFERRQSGTILSKADIPMTLALAGRRGEAESKLANLLAEARTTYVSPYDIATVQAALGDKQVALDGLEEAYAESAGPLHWLKTDPAFATIRSEPRFRTLLSRLGVV